MAFIRATYNSETVSKVSDSSQLATNQTKWWITDEGVDDTLGVWDDVNNRFVPDGVCDYSTGWLWPKDRDWSTYNG